MAESLCNAPATGTMSQSYSDHLRTCCASSSSEQVERKDMPFVAYMIVASRLLGPMASLDTDAIVD